MNIKFFHPQAKFKLNLIKLKQNKFGKKNVQQQKPKII